MQLFHLLTCLGAASFFVAGYLVRTVRARAALAKELSQQAALTALDRMNLESELSRLAEQRATLSTEAAELRRQVLENSCERARAQQEVARLRVELGRAEETAQMLAAERQLRAEAEKAHVEARAGLAKLTKELGEARRLLSAERTSRARSEQQAGSARTALRTLEAERADLLARLESAKVTSRAVESLQQEIDALREDNERQRLAMHELMQQASAKRAPSSLPDPEVLHARLNMAVSQIQRLRSEDAQLRTVVAQAQKDATFARQELEVARASVAEAQRLRTECTELRQGLLSISEELSTAQRRLAELGAEAEAAEFRAIAADALCEEATQKRALVEAELRTMRARLREADARTADLDRLRQQCDALQGEQARRMDLERAAATLESELRETTIMLRTAQSKLDSLEALREEHAALREQWEASGDVSAMLATAQAEARDLRSKLQAADPKLAQFERLVEENRSLREQTSALEEHQQLGAELARLTAEHKRLRLDCEIATRRVQELEEERTELFELRNRVHELDLVASEAVALRKREAQLEAQLFAAGHQPVPVAEPAVSRSDSLAPEAPPVSEQPMSSARPGAHPSGVAPAADSELETALQVLAGIDSVSSVALADDQGLLVAGGGDRSHEEGLAAFAGLADEFATRARTLLPLGRVLRVCLEDGGQLEACCRMFATGGNEYGLATMAKSRLDPQRADDAVASLSKVLADQREASGERAAS